MNLVLDDSDSDSENVLETHRRRNKAQHAPRPAQLAVSVAQRSDTGDEVDSDSGDESGNHAKESIQPPATRNSRSTGGNPTTLGFYPPMWKSFLQEAKQHYRLHIATVHAFPEIANDLHEARALVFRLLAIRHAAGEHLEPSKYC